MADDVLPALLVFLVVGELAGDKLVDGAERLTLLPGLFDRHGYERHIGVRRLDVRVLVFVLRL